MYQHICLVKCLFDRFSLMLVQVFVLVINKSSLLVKGIRTFLFRIVARFLKYTSVNLQNSARSF